MTSRPPTPPIADLAREFATVRDLLRHAVSRFRESPIVFGHGAANAVDEAAFLVLETLHLPVDDINPWLDARLTTAERMEILGRIAARIATRKPAAYLTGRTWIAGVPIRVDERAIVPRSFLAELVTGDLVGGEGFALVEDPAAVMRVLDLCTGSGCLAIIAAGVFPNARIDAVDLSADALALARENVSEAGLGDRIDLLRGDLFAPVKGRRYDLILTNPPYVDAEAMAALPPEYRHEPAMALAGGPDGLAIVRRILQDARKHLTKNGALLCEIGAGRDILEAERPDLDLLWLDTAESEGEVFFATAAGLRGSR